MSLFRKQRRQFGRAIVRKLRQWSDLFFGKPRLPTPSHLPQHILIIRPFFLGDIVLCLPLAQALKEQRPDAHITWLLREEWGELVSGHSAVDEVISFSKSKMHSIGAAAEFFRVAK